MTQDSHSNYKYILEIFGKDKLKKRFAFLKELAGELMKTFGLSGYVVCSDYLIEELLLDYFADIARLKEFHNIEHTNPIKVASYTAYWITKRNPLQLIKDITPEEVLEKRSLRNPNVFFALNVFLGMVFNKCETALSDSQTLKIWNDFLDTFFYCLVYRNLSPQAIELTATALITEPIYSLI
jgi:hypothetical protein